MYIYKAAVIGGGTMGAGIAQVISYSGLPVVLREVSDELVQRALKNAREVYEGRVKKGKMTPEDLESKMNLITGTTKMEDLKDADIVIEAVPEKMELKKKIFQELDQVCSEGAILATNTSALSISALGSVTKRPEKVVGMHFFFPAHVMKLIEVIPGIQTAQETVDEVTSFSESLRKVPVKVGECPGFLVNRLLMPYLNEAVFCLQEGSATIEEIEQAMVGAGWPMGPFTLVDALGLDVCAEVGKVLVAGYGERMQPAALWEALITEGRMGRKGGAGFYQYPDAGNPQAVGMQDDLLKQLIQKVGAKAGAKFSVERLMYGMVNEAVYILQEGISSAADIDMGVVAGLGYPLDQGGILHYADQVGVDQILQGLETMERELGPRFHPAYRIRQMVDAGTLGVKTKKGFFDYA